MVACHQRVAAQLSRLTCHDKPTYLLQDILRDFTRSYSNFRRDLASVLGDVDDVARIVSLLQSSRGNSFITAGMIPAV